MKVFILAVIIIGLAIAGIAIKMFVKPGGMFTKTCAHSFDPFTGKPIKCDCQKNSPDECENADDRVDLVKKASDPNPDLS